MRSGKGIYDSLPDEIRELVLGFDERGNIFLQTGLPQRCYNIRRANC